MATVPIEIVLQDAETPVDPTPESGEETNIVVPNTGTISNDGSSNGGIESSISIILPIVIAVLALSAMVALLIRRQQKRKSNTDAGISKKEKLATAASGTVAILAATVLVGNLVIPATNAATDDANDNEGTYLEAEDKITIIATIDKDSEEDTYIVSTKDTLYATTDASGYTVTMSMIENALTSNLYLNGDESSQYYIAPVGVNENSTEEGTRGTVEELEGTELTNNTWGYTLNEEAEEYLPIPLADTPVTIKEGEEAVTHEEIDVYYTVKVNKELPLGTYSGTIEYNIEGNYGFPDTLTTMQGMTHEICESVPTPNAFKADGVTIEDDVPTVILTDIRDNKTYTIAKLADGKCWMTQNLDLQKEDLLTGVILDSSNTDNPADGFELPDSQNSGNSTWTGGEISFSTAHVYDLEANDETYKYCTNWHPYGYCAEYGDEISSERLGNLYNWYTATAGTGTYDISDGEEASGSVCPARWRILNGGDTGNTTDYSKLLYIYGILQDPDSGEYNSETLTSIFMAPLSFVPTGRYDNGVKNAGEMGYLWSSLSASNTSAKSVYFRVDLTRPWSGEPRTMGLPIRCIAK